MPEEARYSPVRGPCPPPQREPPIYVHRCGSIHDWAAAAGYDFRDALGAGAYSVVERWERISDGADVAIKSIRLRAPFDLREAYQVRVLRHLSRCRRVVRLLEMHQVHLPLASPADSGPASARSSASAQRADGGGDSPGSGAWAGEDPFASETRLLTTHARVSRTPGGAADEAAGAQTGVTLGFLVFELAPASLRDWIASQTPRPNAADGRLALQGYVETVRHFMHELLCALGEVHRCGYVHCDVKPGNILVDPSVHPAVLRLADVGMALDRPYRADRTGVLCTALYRAPELFLGALEFTPAVDVWSAGCVLAEMLTGRAAFGADGPAYQAPGEPDPERWDAARYPPAPTHWAQQQTAAQHLRGMRVMHKILTFTGTERCALAESCGVDVRAHFGAYSAKDHAALLPQGAPAWAARVLSRSLRLDPAARSDAAQLALYLNEHA